SWPERWGRWARRRPWVAGLSAAVLLLTLVVLLGSPVALVTIAAAHHEEWLAKEQALRLAADEKQARLRAEELERRATQAAEDQKAARARAERLEGQALTEADKARQVAAMLAGMFEASDPL